MKCYKIVLRKCKDTHTYNIHCIISHAFILIIYIWLYVLDAAYNILAYNK